MKYINVKLLITLLNLEEIIGLGMSLNEGAVNNIYCMNGGSYR